MTKRNSLIKRGFRKFLIKLILILIAVLFLLLLIGYLLDLNGKIDILAKHTIEQNMRIEKLEVANSRLHSVAAQQYEMIQELQLEPSTSYQPIAEPTNAYEETQSQTKTKELDIRELTDPTVTTAFVVTVISTVGKIISTLLPAIP